MGSGILRCAQEQELADEVSFSAESLALAQRRLARTQHEREKLLQAYFAEAMQLDLFKREQNRIAKEIDLARAEINRADATDSPYGQLLESWVSSGTPGRATRRRIHTSNACGIAPSWSGSISGPARSPESNSRCRSPASSCGPVQIRDVWSGARDLNPGPHRPEPYPSHVLA
jgi:hypothetical protein